ncbi:hypothetical protein GC194_02205, partial [bacterium]|nr:hypothetical protein [bacterium]
MKRSVISLFILFVFRSVSGQLAPVYEGTKSEAVRHDTLVTGSSNSLGVSYLDFSSGRYSVNWMASSPIALSRQNLISSKGLLTLDVDEHYFIDANISCDYTFTVKVITYDFDLNIDSSEITLSIDYNPTVPKIKNTISSSMVFDNIVYMYFEVESIKDNINNTTITDPQDNLRLTGTISVERYFDFDPDANCTTNWDVAGTFTYLPASNEFIIAQPMSCNDWLDALGWEIEWTYVDNYNTDRDLSDTSYWSPERDSFRLKKSAVNYNFSKNATRVRLPISTLEYSISNVFEEGFVLVRVRKIGRRGSAFQQIYEGSWFPSTPSGTVDGYSSNFYLHINNKTIPSHESSLKTWQYVASYAENGKNKEVVSYFDGLNKNRQAVTRLSTDNTIVAGETVYDYQGRPAVQILPVPLNIGGVLEYNDNINRSGVDPSHLPYNASHFDGKAMPDALDSTTAGASNYYSSSNTLSGIHKDFIPDAHGFPFTQTVFTKDGTGRVKYQSGVGPDHRIGSGHEIRYEYVKPPQIMLDGLFGSEAGFAKHYKESIVIDANGQISVSYIDQHGRVVATSLAGDNPENLISLDSKIDTSSASRLDINFITEGIKTEYSSVHPYAYELNYSYFSMGDVAHKFWYEFQPEKYMLTCNSLCYDCVYKLTVTIRSEETGSVIYTDTRDVGPITNYDDVCDGDTIIKLWSGDSLDNSGFTVKLPVGKYHIFKRLEINKDAEEAYWKNYLRNKDACFIPFDSFLQDAYSYAIDCDSMVGYTETDTLPLFLQMLKKQLLLDVSKGGQYGAYELNGQYFSPEGIIDSVKYRKKYGKVSVYDDNNIFGVIYKWHVPCTPYKDEFGDDELILNESTGDYTGPESLPYSQYIREWKPSWANSLILQHPEYPYFHLGLQYYESFLYDDALRATDSYEDALASAYISPTHKRKILELDPMYQIILDTVFIDSVNYTISGLPEDFLKVAQWVVYRDMMDKTVKSPLKQGGVMYSLKRMAAMTECLQYTGNATICQYADNFGDTSLSKDRLDAQWMAYKNIYLGQKQRLINFLFKQSADNIYKGFTYYLRDSNEFKDSASFASRYGLFSGSSHTKLLSDKKRRYFFPEDQMGIDIYRQDYKQLNHDAGLWVASKMNDHCEVQCSTYVDSWRKDLEMCDATSEKMDSIISGFLEVCKLGCNANYPFGRVDLPNGVSTPSGYTSFNNVLETLLGTTKAHNNYCNNLLIEFPRGTEHNLFPNESKVAEADIDCSCQLLAAKMKEFNEIKVHPAECLEWREPDSSYTISKYFNYDNKLTAFLNDLASHGKFDDVTDTNYFDLTSSYTGFDSIRTFLKHPSANYKCKVSVEQMFNLSKLIINIQNKGKRKDFYNIEIYHIISKIGTSYSGINFSNFNNSVGFKLDGIHRVGFSLYCSTSLSTTAKLLYGITFNFKIPENHVEVKRFGGGKGRCVKWKPATTKNLITFLHKSGIDVTWDEIYSWGKVCKGISVEYDTTITNFMGKWSNNSFALESYGVPFYPDIEQIEYDLTYWLDQAAWHDKDSVGNPYHGYLSQDFSIGNEYGYHSTSADTPKYHFLPDSFTRFYYFLDGYYKKRDNFNEVKDTAISCKCAFDSSTVMPITNFIWGGYIGAGDDPPVDISYVALAKIPRDKEKYYNVYNGSFSVNDIDSVVNYRYDNFLDRYLVDCYLDVGSGVWTTLIFFNEYQEYACKDDCYSVQQRVVKRGHTKYLTSCQLNLCRLASFQDFLNELNTNDKLYRKTYTDVYSYDGYDLSYDFNKSLQWFRRGSNGYYGNSYKALENVDSTTTNDTLDAVIGINKSSPVYLTLIKGNSSINWSNIDSFYGIMVDTGKVVDQYITRKSNGYGIILGNFVEMKAKSGSTEFVVRGYTNLFNFGVCEVEERTSTYLEPTSDTLAAKYSYAIPGSVKKHCPACLSCESIYDALLDFYTLYPQLGYNHVNHNKMMTNYLNKRFGNNLYAYEYLDFVKACKLTDSLVVNRNECGYSFIAKETETARTLDSIKAFNDHLNSRFGINLVFKRDSVGTGDYYCFDLSAINSSRYLKILSRLESIASDTTKYIDQLIDDFDDFDLSIDFLNKPYTGSCRQAVREYLTDSVSTLFPAATFDSVYINENTPLGWKNKQFIKYRINYNVLNNPDIYKLTYNLQEIVKACPATKIYGKHYMEAHTKVVDSDTICTFSFVSQSQKCISCGTIESAILEYKPTLAERLNTPYDELLEAHLQDELRKSLTVEMETTDCASCGNKKIFICEEISDVAGQWQIFLNALAGADKLLDEAVELNGISEFYLTSLYPDDNSPIKVYYNGYSTAATAGAPTDSMEINMLDSNGYRNYGILFSEEQDAVDFNHVTGFQNIRAHVKGGGINNWFYIDAYDAVQAKWVTLEGYTSRYKITKCCEFEEQKLCYKPYFREQKLEENPCDSLRENMVRLSAFSKYNDYMYLQERIFKESYRQKCASARSSEVFKMQFPQLQNHFTLYYYDIGGNLVRTVPPKGALFKEDVDTAKAREWRTKSFADATADMEDGSGNPNYELTPHKLATFYEYNTLNEVVRQKTPDGGISKFYYDRLGRIVYSQNAEQAGRGNIYSYTYYDALGRIREVGEIALGYPVDLDSLKDIGSYFKARFYSGFRSQITRSCYDAPLSTTVDGLMGDDGQTYLRNRVAAVYYLTDTTADYSFASHYSYDVHGNVKTIIQEFVELEDFGSRYKRIDYEYDLVSGNVNKVCYQPGEADQFFHEYEYDADNRITKVFTSKDNINWERDARYEYYLHGPLARTTIGNNRVQAMDYAYTIHGWLKAVNSSTLNIHNDMGSDGHNNPHVARDVIGYTLGYYDGDYHAIGSNKHIAQRGSTGFGGTAEGLDLYNGNIGYMSTANRAFLKMGKGVLGMNYKYDQLNRIKTSNAHFLTDTSRNATWNGVSDTNLYHTSYSYDPNGNILNLVRNGHRDTNTTMDNLTYHYYSGTNRLKGVADAVLKDDIYSNENGGVEDLNSGQDTTGNYHYDPIGNLISDKQEQIRNIEWTVYGKVSKVQRADTSGKANMQFKYDASGNRVVKLVKPTPNPITWRYTYYMRDAQGNVMAVYNLQNGLEDSTLNDSMITNWLISEYGLSGVAAMFNKYYKTNNSFITGLIQALEDTDYDTLVINEYSLSSILGWDNSHATDILLAYNNNPSDFDAIIDSLIQRYRGDVVDGLAAGNLSSLLADVLDVNANLFLQCFSESDLDAIYTAVIGGTPPAGVAAKVTALSNPSYRTSLLTELVGSYSSTSITYLKSCIDQTTLLNALKFGSHLSDYVILQGAASGIGAAELVTFFTTNGDAVSWRPKYLLKTYGTHAYILNVIAQNSPSDFIENSITQDR